MNTGSHKHKRVQRGLVNRTGLLNIFRRVWETGKPEQHPAIEETQERHRELRCLYNFFRLAGRRDISMEDLFQRTVNLVPSAWQYPEIACARITVEDQAFNTRNFSETTWKQTGDIIMYGERIGSLEVCYLEEKPEMEEGPFLRKERGLLNTIAKQLGIIAEQKEIEHWLLESRLRLEGFMDSATDGFILVDNQLNLIDINEAALQMLPVGDSKRDIIGKNMAELMPDVEVTGRYDRYVEVLRRGTPLFMDDVIPHPELGDIHLAVKAFRVGDGLGIIASDITERKWVEELAHKAREYAESIVETIREPLVVLDADMKVISANRSFYQTFSVTSEETDGQLLHDLGNRQWDVPELRKLLDDTLLYNTTFEKYEVDHDFETIGPRTMLVNGRRVFGEMDESQMVLLTIEDITERKQAERDRLNLETQLQQAQKQESLHLLASGIAHDFNNMLVGILGMADLLSGMLPPASAAYDHVEDIRRTAQSAGDLAREMLIYSGGGEFVFELINLSSIIEGMSHLIGASISKEISIEYDLVEDVPMIEAEPTQIRQVIMNLITNAAEAIGSERGAITITTGTIECDHDYLAGSDFGVSLPEGRYVFLGVADSGCGIDEETEARLFDPFFTTKREGRGLGLAVTLGIVLSHDGAIDVHSEVGQGTAIKVLFPASEQPAAIVSRPDLEALNQCGEGVVLIVDDEADARQVAEEMLTEYGFEVLIAVNGREAVEVFRRHADEIVLVLLDWMMPDIDGEKVFREIRRIRNDACVLLSSGYTERDIMGRLTDQGIAGFLQKPYDKAALVAKIREVLSV